MPLKCFLDGKEILSFSMSNDDWGQLKETYTGRGLTMPCCGVQAIPKVSPLGTRFFAHKADASCGSAGESEAHMRAKWVIARAAVAAGWHAGTEVVGASPAGEEWVADVLCNRGKGRVAFEVQLSQQTEAERNTRHVRYAASGIRGCWLSSRVPDREVKDVPDFHLSMGNLREPRVTMAPQFTLPLHEFVTGSLNGSLLSI